MSITNHVSIFEIVAADNLSQELRLSLRHVIGVSDSIRDFLEPAR